jgi:hypothetical protein
MSISPEAGVTISKTMPKPTDIFNAHTLDKHIVIEGESFRIKLETTEDGMINHSNTLY